jgi:hypothetical protein
VRNETKVKLSLCAIKSDVAKQQLGKYGPMATNTDAAIEELLDSHFLRGPGLTNGKWTILPRSCSDLPVFMISMI